MTTSASTMQNSPMRTPGPITASGETMAVGAITADGSMGMKSYDKRRWDQTGRRLRHRAEEERQGCGPDSRGVVSGSRDGFDGGPDRDPFAQGVEEEFQLDWFGEVVVHACRQT